MQTKQHGLTQRQRDWAAQHDWYVECQYLNWLDEEPPRYAVLVEENISQIDGQLQTAKQLFTDFQALYEWAGY